MLFSPLLSSLAFKLLAFDPLDFPFKLVLPSFFVFAEFVVQVETMVLLREFDDEVGLFRLEILCLCFFDDVLKLSFLVSRSLLESVH